MNFNIEILDTKTDIATMKTAMLIIGIFENRKLVYTAQTLNKINTFNHALKSEDITGEPGFTMVLRNIFDIIAERLVLVGFGMEEKTTEKNFITGMYALTHILSTLKADDAILILPVEKIKNRDLSWAIRTIITTICDYNYHLDIMKSKKVKLINMKKITIALPTAIVATAKQYLTEALALTNGIRLAKDLGNLPSNICTPTYLANAAKKLATEFNIKFKILNRKQLEILKMNSFLSVANSSKEQPKFIIIKYLGGNFKDAPIILVGKGITFDTGGISLKPSVKMDEMKYDMCGAASVLGVFRTIVELKIKLNIFGIIPTCENMLSAYSTKPGDIITSMSGQTIEVLNTDAEGRLILCDALTYVERFKPAVVIDIATLTGACVVALGHHHSGLFTREDEAHNLLAIDLLKAGQITGDTVWRMPMQEAYQEQLQSNFADIANVGEQAAGSITAACFLEHFTKKYTWAHLDIAGTAWKSGTKKCATGRPVALLIYYLLNKARKNLENYAI